MGDETGSLRVVFAGTPDFSVPSLEVIEESRHEVVGVVTNPDRRRGRSGEPTPSAVKAAALECDVPVHQPEDVGTEESVERIAAWEPDVLVVAAYGQILPEELLDVPAKLPLNIHASLLPKYRGAAPINWAILEGERRTGISIMEMEPDLDTGPVLVREAVEIGPLETAGELHDRLAELGAGLIVDALDAVAAGRAEPEPQDDEAATYAPKLSTSDGDIDWTEPADRVAAHVRGMNPWPGAFSHHEEGDGERIKFHLARPVDSPAGEPGEVVVADRGEGRLLVGCGEGAVECLELQAPGGRAMEADDFLNGYSVEEGDRFTSE